RFDHSYMRLEELASVVPGTVVVRPENFSQPTLALRDGYVLGSVWPQHSLPDEARTPATSLHLSLGSSGRELGGPLLGEERERVASDVIDFLPEVTDGGIAQVTYIEGVGTSLLELTATLVGPASGPVPGPTGMRFYHRRERFRGRRELRVVYRLYS